MKKSSINLKETDRRKKEIQDIWNKQDYGEAKLVGDYINYKRTNVQIK